MQLALDVFTACIGCKACISCFFIFYTTFRTSGDGNCLYNACSIALSGSETLATYLQSTVINSFFLVHLNINAILPNIIVLDFLFLREI